MLVCTLQICIGAGDGELLQDWRRAVASLLDPVFIHHTHGDGPAIPNLLVNLLCRPVFLSHWMRSTWHRIHGHLISISMNFRIPVWYELKLLFMAWLVLPNFRGAAFIYNMFVRELVKMHTGIQAARAGSTSNNDTANKDNKIFSTSPEEKKSKRKLLSMIFKKKLKFWSICTRKRNSFFVHFCVIFFNMISYLKFRISVSFCCSLLMFFVQKAASCIIILCIGR